jgi:LPPG:FO 2-phospho-L-lactate transferase
MKVVALAGGIGAGKFLRGLVRVMDPADLTVVVNTADDITIHGLHVSPDVDSVLYALSDLADRERGWGRAGETFRATGELRDRFAAADAWFNLGDLDLATHLYRTQLERDGATATQATATIATRLGIAATILPMSDAPVTTRIEASGPDGQTLDLHFQEYWVGREGTDSVKGVRFEGIESSAPAPGVVDALRKADVVLFCPSNPVVSIGPILAVPGMRDALAERRSQAGGISPIVGGAPVRGMADKLMPAAGFEVTALGAARSYDGLLSAWVIDEQDRAIAPHIEEELGLRVGITDTIMGDENDEKAATLAAFTLETLA